MIYFVGPFPPPLHGMSAITQAMYQRLLAEGKEIVRLDIAPKTLKRDVFSRLSRLGKIKTAWITISRSGSKDDVLYLSLSGGWGQIYDLVTLGIARIKKMHCIIHHHNFSYLGKKRVLTSFLFSLAGKHTSHIVLCDEMGNMLRQQYGNHYKVIVLSNLVFFGAEKVKRTEEVSLQKIGFISNITYAKGGETVIQLARKIREMGLPLKVIVAGPCYEEDLRNKLLNAMKDGVLDWRGAIYGEEKMKFWQEIDALVFPSYENEAEPLVVWEALGASIPVISFRRGCIVAQMGETSLLLDPQQDFVEAAIRILSRWIEDKKQYQTAVQQAQFQYEVMVDRTYSQWQTFLSSELVSE